MIMAKPILPEERARRKAHWLPVRALLHDQGRSFVWLHRQIVEETGMSYMAFNNIANGYNFTPLWLWRMVCRAIEKPEWLQVALPKRTVH